MLNDFLLELKTQLQDQHIEDSQDILDFIQEMISDRLDNGEKLEDILASLGDPATIARSFLDDGSEPTTKTETMENPVRRRLEYDALIDLNIENISCDYEISPSDGDKVIVEYDDRQEQYLDIRYRDGRLSISQEWNYDLKDIFRKRISLKEMTRSTVRILIPRGSCPDLDLENVSGCIRIKELEFKKVELEGVSGDIELNLISCRSLEAENVSGTIMVNDVAVEKYAALENVSGTIKGERIAARRLSGETVSGRIDLTICGRADDYDIKTSSLLNSRKFKGSGYGSLTLETVSGHISYDFI